MFFESWQAALEMGGYSQYIWSAILVGVFSYAFLLSWQLYQHSKCMQLIVHFNRLKERKLSAKKTAKARTHQEIKP